MLDKWLVGLGLSKTKTIKLYCPECRGLHDIDIKTPINQSFLCPTTGNLIKLIWAEVKTFGFKLEKF